MHRHSTCIVIAFSTLLLTSVCLAQQTSGSKSTNSGEDASPIRIDGPVIGGDGTKNYIPIWATPNYLMSSAIYQDANKNIGIGTTTPGATLDVNGGINTAMTYQIGGNTVMSIAGSENLFLGLLAGFSNAGGNQNTFSGPFAGSSNTTGAANTFSGFGAGGANMTGSGNTFSGVVAGSSNTTGSNNTFYGYGTGVNNAGSFNTFVGVDAGDNSTTGNNNIYVGNVGCTFPCSENSTIRIGGNVGYGSPQTTAYIAGIYGSTASGGVPVYITANGQLGTSASSLRFKEQVRDMGNSTAGLMRLRPVTFFYRPEYDKGERTLQYGLIAEEVAKVYPELVAYDNDGQPYSVRYQYLATMLLNEAQKQYHRAEAQSEVIKAQEQKIDDLEQRLSRLERLVGNQAQIVAQK